MARSRGRCSTRAIWPVSLKVNSSSKRGTAKHLARADLDCRPITLQYWVVYAGEIRASRATAPQCALNVRFADNLVLAATSTTLPARKLPTRRAADRSTVRIAWTSLSTTCSVTRESSAPRGLLALVWRATVLCERVNDGTCICGVGTGDPRRGGAGPGVSVVWVEPASGALELRQQVRGLHSPTYLALHPRLPVLYAGERHWPPMGAPSPGTRTITTFAVEAQDGTLTQMGTLPTGGVAHLNVHPDGRFVVAPMVARHRVRVSAGR